MPDLNDDLFSSFKNEGSPVTPLPASEVRRRGDRMRRRNNTLAAVGGVAAALVVIATPLAVVANQSTESDGVEPGTMPTKVVWTQEIPDSVDVSAGIQGIDTAQDPEPTDEAALGQIDLCGSTVFDAAATADVQGAHYQPLEATDLSVDRDLALYRDDAAAQAATAAVRDAATACSGSGADAISYTVTDGGLDADESFVVTALNESFATKDYYVVARTGNAVLITYTVGINDDPNADEVQEEQDAVADVVDQMQVFSEANAMRVEVDDTVELPDLIPNEFPLLDGWPEDSAFTAPFGRKGPSHDLNLARFDTDLTACGTEPSGLPEPTDTLYAGLRQVEGPQLRQLMSFDIEEDAQAYADAVVGHYAECGQETDADGATRVHEIVETDGVGDYAGTVITRFEFDGETMSGHRAVQVVRVGSGVLLFFASIDGDVGVDAVDPGTDVQNLVATYLATNSPVLDAM